MADLSAVVNQLKQNNDDARYGNLQLNQNVEASRKENSDGLKKLSESIIKNTASILKDVTVPIVKNAEQEKENAKATSTKIDTEKDGRILLFKNLAKQGNIISSSFNGIKSLFVKNKGAEEEKLNRMTRFQNAVTKGILNLNDKFNGFLKGIGSAAKEKVKDVFGILKKFAIVGALGALIAFLDSDLFKTIKDKTIPYIVEKFTQLKDTLGSIFDGFIGPDGEFDFIGGIKNAFTEIRDNFGVLAGATALGSLVLLTRPGRFFGKTAFTVGKGLFSVALGTIRGAFGLLTGNLGDVGTNLDTIDKNQKKKLATAKKSGIFSKGKMGFSSRFGKIFGRLGALGFAIGGASALMGADLDVAKGEGGVFSKVGRAFKSMFSVVGDFAKGLIGIKDTAAKDLKKTLDDPDGKKAKAEADAKKKADMNKFKAADKKSMQGVNVNKTTSSPPKSGDAPKATDTSSKTTSSSSSSSKPKNLDIAGGAKMKASFMKGVARMGIKSVAVLGAGFGLFETARRLAGGDFGGALRELGGVFLPSVTGLPVDASLIATDMYRDMYGTTYEGDMIKDPGLANQRMGTIMNYVRDNLMGKDGMPKQAPLMLKSDLSKGQKRQLSRKGRFNFQGQVYTKSQIVDAFPEDYTGPRGNASSVSTNTTARNGGGIDPIALRTGSAPIVVNNVNNSKVVSDNSQQTVTSVPIQDIGLHPSSIMD